jgi:hypothetical protein
MASAPLPKTAANNHNIANLTRVQPYTLSSLEAHPCLLWCLSWLLSCIMISGKELSTTNAEMNILRPKHCCCIGSIPDGAAWMWCQAGCY